jgi:hypothetical protein
VGAGRPRTLRILPPGVGLPNVYMSACNSLRLDIKHEKIEIKADEPRVDGAKDKGDENAEKLDDRRAA